MAYRIARKKIALFCSAAGLATAGLTPMPVDPPVISTTLPSTLNSSVIFTGLAPPDE